MLTDEVCEELEVSKTTLGGYIKRGIIAKPKKISIKNNNASKNSWTQEQVEEAKVNQANQSQQHVKGGKRKDHTPTETSANLLNNVFGAR